MQKVYTQLLPLVFLLCSAFAASSQTKELTASDTLAFYDIIRVNRPLSYVTFAEGVGNLEPLLFEAQIASSFFVVGKKKQWALQLSPHILMRMKRTKSLPVENPSYKLPLFFHQHLNFWNKLFAGKGFYNNAYLSLGLTHHSNGQAGPFFKDDGSINLENGSFSTNFASAAITLYQGKDRKKLPGFSLLELYYERHLPWFAFETSLYEEPLKGLYGLDRLKLKYSNLNLSRKQEEIPGKFLSNSRLISQAGWIFGPLAGSDAGGFQERLLFSLKYLYYPQWLNEIALFTEFYRGQDYYNIRFARNLTFFRIGLISDPLNLGAAAELFRSKK